MRKLMWFTVGFGSACVFATYFYNACLLPISMSCLLLCGMLFLLRNRNKGFRIACSIFLGAALGLSAFMLHDHFIWKNVRQIDDQTEIKIIEVTDYSYPTDHGSAFDGRVLIGDSPYKVRVYLGGDVMLEPGQYIQGNFRFEMTLRNTENLLNRAGKGIFLFAYQRDAGINIVDFQRNLRHYPAIWRQNLTDMIHAVFPDDTEGFAQALLLGDTSEIDYKTETDMKVSGIRHVIAVSGLHISVSFGLLYLVAFKKRFLTALIGIPAVILFAALAGFTPSVTRACIMQILMMTALLLDKEYDPPTALAFAVLVMLAVNPMAIASVSFQLSVSCMIGIFLFTQRIQNWLRNLSLFRKWKGKVAGGFFVSVSVTLSTMVTTTPLAAYYFGTVSLIGVVTNLITVWAIMIIFYGIMLSCTLGYVFLPMAQVVGAIFGWLIRYVKAAAATMAAVPLSAVYTNSIYIILWLLFVYALLTVYLLIKKKPAVLFAGLTIFGLCLAVAFSWLEPMLGECRVTMLDVGQGQAILLQSKGKTFLVDCGGDYDEGAADTTAQTLLSQGICKVDGIILTHYDSDHAGGIPYLLTRIKADNLFLPYTEDARDMVSEYEILTDATVHMINRDVNLSIDSAQISIFAPVTYKSGNESSMCILFRTENCDILITGDRSENTEKLLLNRMDLPELDVLVAGHHGAKTATGVQLLEATKPEYVFISVGKDNPYGHPAQETIERILGFGCKILRTDECGTIIFRR